MICIRCLRVLYRFKIILSFFWNGFCMFPMFILCQVPELHRFVDRHARCLVPAMVRWGFGSGVCLGALLPASPWTFAPPSGSSEQKLRSWNDGFFRCPCRPVTVRRCFFPAKQANENEHRNIITCFWDILRRFFGVSIVPAIAATGAHEVFFQVGALWLWFNQMFTTYVYLTWQASYISKTRWRWGELGNDTIHLMCFNHTQGGWIEQVDCQFWWRLR